MTGAKHTPPTVPSHTIPVTHLAGSIHERDFKLDVHFCIIKGESVSIVSFANGFAINEPIDGLLLKSALTDGAVLGCFMLG